MKKTQFKIGLGTVNIDKKTKDYVLDVLRNNRLTYGPYINKLETKFAKIHNRKFATFCNSGTSALHVGFHALKKRYEWQDGAEVIVPALTFVASINTILQNNLTPIFVDIDPIYYELDPEKIEEKITSNTVAIEPVHLLGQPCDMEPIMAIAKKHKLAVIEDSCETMFSSYKGQVVGSWGDISCFSTYAAHLLVTGVGGFATTNDKDLAVLIKSLINHGRDGIYLAIDDDDNTTDRGKLRMVIERRFNFIDIGYSYRGTELEGAVGLAQLEHWVDMIKKRQYNAQYLSDKLSPLSDFFQLPSVRRDTTHSFMNYPIVIKHLSINLLDLIMYLEENNIETRFLLPTLTQPVYKKLFGEISKNYPVAEWASSYGFYIGCHQDLTQKNLDYIIDCFYSFLREKKLIG